MTRPLSPSDEQQSVAFALGRKHAAGVIVAADVADAVSVLGMAQVPEPARRHMEAIVRRAQTLGGPGVPVSTVGELLGLSQQTVRAWIDRGVLTTVDGTRTVQVTPGSLGEVLAALDTLRSVGRDRRLLARILDAVDDARTRRGLTAELAEMADRVEFDPDDTEALFG